MLWCQSWCQKDRTLVQWVGVGVRWGWGWESSIVTRIRPPGFSLWLYQRMVAPLYIRWRAGGGGGVPRQHKIPWDHSPSSPHPSPWKNQKKGGSLWQDTYREQQRVCFFYLFLSLKEMKRRPGVNSSIPGWWCPPPLHEAAGAPELSGGGFVPQSKQSKKEINPGRRGVFLHGCALYVVPWWTHVLSLFILFFRTGRPSLPSAFTPPPCPSPTCAFSCRAL